ncbi:MAG TPA: cell division protein FtsZ [Acidimicrobiaceae bacterium]|nr:cell division protein FtsZ [Acidimicrobiaceae bacterium]HCB36704.1 cell division protein FtsZ [Acidimicrobiaceae bacterium]
MNLPATYVVTIRVVGVGGGGSNAVNRMIEANLPGIESIAVNTDAQALMLSDAQVTLDIGRQTTKGLGAGSDPEVGEHAAQEHRADIAGALKGSDMVFITAGEGGGTGSGAAPVVAEVARELGALTIGVVTRPFTFEGKRRQLQAEQGIDRLREKVDTLIVIPNDRLLSMATQQTSILDAFRMADDVLHAGVSGISGLITTPGLINTDFADVRMIMADAGTALMGIGVSHGDNRAANSARAAVESELMEESIAGARGILLNIAAGPELTLHEVNEVAETVQERSSADCHIIFGTVIDESLGEDIRVTVVAAGFDRSGDPGYPRTEGGDTWVADEDQEMPDPFSDADADDADDSFDVPHFLR